MGLPLPYPSPWPRLSQVFTGWAHFFASFCSHFRALIFTSILMRFGMDLPPKTLPKSSQNPSKRRLGDHLGPVPRKDSILKAPKYQNGPPNGANIEQESKNNVVEKQHDFGRVFFMDLDDFPSNFGTTFGYFLGLFQKVEKA